VPSALRTIRPGACWANVVPELITASKSDGARYCPSRGNLAHQCWTLLAGRLWRAVPHTVSPISDYRQFGQAARVCLIRHTRAERCDYGLLSYLAAGTGTLDVFHQCSFPRLTLPALPLLKRRIAH
jgi:NCAIR mutase (PurE)-related protein